MRGNKSIIMVILFYAAMAVGLVCSAILYPVFTAAIIGLGLTMGICDFVETKKTIK